VSAIAHSRTVLYVLHALYFFFQAEDGIRDFHVTGVQTCALPIFSVEVEENAKFNAKLLKAWTGGDEITAAAKYEAEVSFRPAGKIGRASCRERGQGEEGAETAKMMSSGWRGRTRRTAASEVATEG